MQAFNVISRLIRKVANWEASCSTIHTSIFSGPIMIFFGLYLGFDVLPIIMTGFACRVTGFAQHFGLWLSKRTRRKQQFSFLFQTGSILVSALYPFLLYVSDMNIKFLLYLIINVTQAALYFIGSAIYCDWVGSNMPEKQVASFNRNRSTVSLIASVSSIMIGAFILQKLPDFAKQIPFIGPNISNPQISAFFTVFWIAALAGFIGSVPKMVFTEEDQYKKIEPVSIKSLFETFFSKDNRLLLIFIIPVSAGFYSIIDLFHFYVLKDLKMTLIFSALLLIFALLTLFFTRNFWPYLANRFGMKTVLRFICLIGTTIIPISSFLATIQTPAFLIITAVAIGCCASSIRSLLPAFPMKLVPTDKQSISFVTFGSFTSVGAGIGLIIGAAIMHFLHPITLPTFLGIQLLPYHFVNIESIAFFLIAFFIGYKITEPGAARLRDLVMYLIRRAIRLGKEEENIATNQEFEKEKDDSIDNSKEDK